MPADLVAAPLAPSRPWWRRLLGGTAASAGPAGDMAASGTPGHDRPPGEEGAGTGTGGAVRGGEPDRDDASGAQPVREGPGGPVGLLVSADRYDLSES